MERAASMFLAASISRRSVLFGSAAMAGAALVALDGPRGPRRLLAQAPAAAPVREITKLAGEVYRFRNANHYSIFAVTPAGVIATDPINADEARWLRAEITRRFNQPVRYLVYSHDHADHIARRRLA